MKKISEFNFLFAVILAGNCGENFNNASQLMIDSPATSEAVKAIFRRFQAALEALQPCVQTFDVECMEKAFENIGVRGMEEGIKVTTGKLQLLFKRMLNKDLVAVSEFNKIQESDGKEGLLIACDAFNTKSRWIRQFTKTAQ